MFQFTKPTSVAIEKAIVVAGGLAPATPPVLTLLGGSIHARLPSGFVLDRSESEIGAGSTVFERARQAFAAWAHFNLGWVRVANPSIPISTGNVVAVEVHAAGLWSLNLSRIVETVDTPSQFGFLYGTTSLHVEEGQERFLVEYHPHTQSVTYLLEAISRPRHPLERLAYPFTRAMQHRFARDSHTCLRLAIDKPFC